MTLRFCIRVPLLIPCAQLKAVVTGLVPLLKKFDTSPAVNRKSKKKKTIRQALRSLISADVDLTFGDLSGTSITLIFFFSVCNSAK
jgi:hypothetical protein